VMSENTYHFSTKSVLRHNIKGPVTPVATPIFTSSTFVLESAAHGAALCDPNTLIGDVKEGSPWLYARWGNPTNDVAAQAITDLEGGFGSFVTSSGMAAISTTIMSFVSAGDHVIAPQCVYGGTYELLSNLLSRFQVEVTFVDSTIVSNYEAAIKKNTKLLYGETPANPTMSLLDLEALGNIGKKHSIVTAVDSTFASPYNQKPLSLGIDIVIHSATKYLGGHSDIVAGTITPKNRELMEKIFPQYKLFGNGLSALDSFLLARGIKTLDVRMERHNKVALEVAQYLEKHEKVERVYYPGLESHSNHALAKKQMTGFGGMIAFEVKGGADAGKTVIENVKLITLAVSLGGVESLIEHAASMTHINVSREERIKAGITDGLIRLSIGLEHHLDLIEDLNQALSKI